MKKSFSILMLLPIFALGQVKVEVTEKQSISQQVSQSIQAGAASRAAAAELEKARAAKAAAMNESQVDIKTPLDVDLNNYTHIALINVTYSKFAGKQLSNKNTYTDMEEQGLSDSPLTILNPYKVDKRRAKKDKKFLRETNNPKWLYFYYTKSIQGVDEIRRLIIRDFQNKTIYNVTTRNVPFEQTIEPIVFF